MPIRRAFALALVILASACASAPQPVADAAAETIDIVDAARVAVRTAQSSGLHACCAERAARATDAWLVDVRCAERTAAVTVDGSGAVRELRVLH